MSDEKNMSNNENQLLADLDAYRTGEERDAFSNDESMNQMERQVLGDLEKISDLFAGARPDSGKIPETTDNAVLGYIRQKSRVIRRERKVVHLVPLYKWAAAAVMGILVCVFSFNLNHKVDKPADISSKDNTIITLAEPSKDADIKNKFIVQNDQTVKTRLVSTEVAQRKSAVKSISAVLPASNISKYDLKSIPPNPSEDIDGNGKVNIIDAYLMNRRLTSGVAMPKKLDLNGDGNINHEDINTIIKTAVSLEGGKV